MPNHPVMSWLPASPLGQGTYRHDALAAAGDYGLHANGGEMFRAWIYDRALIPITGAWYRAVLERVPAGAHILDVGVGTGGALAANADLIRERDLSLVGVDIDEDYVRRCRERLKRCALDSRVDVRHESVDAHEGDNYDAVYFSASFMLLPEPAEALRHVASMLVPDGRVYFTQTFFERRSPVMERLKPMLRRFTTVDFGRVTYEHDFQEVLGQGGMELEEMVVLARHRNRTSRLAVARPERG